MTDENPSAPARRRLEPRTVGAVIAGLLLLWFAAANWQSVSIRFWISSERAPVVVVIVVAAALGGFVVWLAGRWRRPKGRD